jgi:hypothetical protein
MQAKNQIIFFSEILSFANPVGEHSSVDPVYSLLGACNQREDV